MFATFIHGIRHIHNKIKTMKKLISISVAGLGCYTTNAQDQGDPYLQYSGEMFRIIATIFVILIFMFFILNIMKRVFEHRLKNKIVDKGITENIAQSLLETKKAEDKNVNIKWFALLAGLGIGLTGVNYTQPLGYHSLAIMAFSISLSFLGYYLFIRNNKD
jgi:drug/metabolite transporter (DMT)-like permease